MRPVRHLAFVVVALLACLALPLAIVSTWTANVVTDSDGYVEAVGPLADDPTVQEAVEERLQAEVLARLPRVPPRTVRRAVVRVVEGPEFRPAWEDANRSAHDQLVTALEASEDSPVADDGTVTIELGTLLVAVIETVDTQGRVDTSNAPDIRTEFNLVSARAARAGPHDVPARAPGRPLDAGGLAAARWPSRCWSRSTAAGRWPGWRSGPWSAPAGCCSRCRWPAGR